MNRLVLVLTSMMLISSSAFGAAGNVNNDSTVDLNDVIMSLQVAAGLIPAGVLTSGDANNNGKIGLEEAIYGLQMVAGMIPSETFAIQSSVFADGQPVPVKYANTVITGGKNVSPPLSWSNPPYGVKSYVLIMDDPDAVPIAGEVWDHWIVYDIPSDTTSLAENAGAAGGANLPAGAKHGTNSDPVNNYTGPYPPPGSPHRYYFKLYALSAQTLAPSAITKDMIEAAMVGRILGQCQLMGTFTAQ